MSVRQSVHCPTRQPGFLNTDPCFREHYRGQPHEGPQRHRPQLRRRVGPGAVRAAAKQGPQRATPSGSLYSSLGSSLYNRSGLHNGGPADNGLSVVCAAHHEPAPCVASSPSVLRTLRESASAGEPPAGLADDPGPGLCLDPALGVQPDPACPVVRVRSPEQSASGGLHSRVLAADEPSSSGRLADPAWDQSVAAATPGARTAHPSWPAAPAGTPPAPPGQPGCTGGPNDAGADGGGVLSRGGLLPLAQLVGGTTARTGGPAPVPVPRGGLDTVVPAAAVNPDPGRGPGEQGAGGYRGQHRRSVPPGARHVPPRKQGSGPVPGGGQFD